MHDSTTETLDAEFETVLARAGMVVPPERHAVVFAGYADFRAQMDLLHARLDATQEPSNIFRAKGVAR
jgi:hypothetical protein